MPRLVDPVYRFFPSTLLNADLSTVPAFSTSFLVSAAVTQILMLGLCSIISCSQFRLVLLSSTPCSAQISTTSCSCLSCSSRGDSMRTAEAATGLMWMWMRGDSSAEGIWMVVMASRMWRRARTFSGRVERGWAGSVEVRGMERSEMASEAETARRGGRAAEKTKEGELMRCRRTQS